MTRWPVIAVALAWYWQPKPRPPIVELSPGPWFKRGDQIEIAEQKIVFDRWRLTREYLIVYMDVYDVSSRKYAFYPIVHIPRDGRMVCAYGVAWRIA